MACARGIVMRTNVIREAVPGDAPACAAIFNDWVDATDWMPRVHSKADVVGYYREHLFAQCRVFVAGENGVVGFLALDKAAGFIAACYLSAKARGRGLGKMLLDRAKEVCPEGLSLWTFVANTRALRFYEREGLFEARRTDGDNEEGLPDILYGWAV